MPTPVWTGGTLKLPGDLVQPVSLAAAVSTAIANPGFESGDVSWTKSAGVTIVNEAGSFAGNWHAKSVYAAGATTSIAMAATVPVVAGQSITAACMIQASGGDDQIGGQVRIMWLDAADGVVSTAPGNEVNVINGATYRASSVTAVAPAGATKMRLQADTFNLRAAGVVRIDNFTWNYVAPASSAGLIYRAVQAAAGTTAASEPVWPTTLGLTVIDGGVTWEATQASRVEWTATPPLLSDGTEPDWPLGVGGVVVDGSVVWEAVSRGVTDPKCPHTKEVVIAASKVYAADGDIIRYSATVDPTDWSTADDAGYLPYGLQNYGASPVAALGLYRSNVVGFNSQGFQMWQVDEDPANSALLDALPVGSTWHRALSPVSNDMLFLSSQGVRTIGIAGGSNNLAAGDAGMPIDPLVQDAVRVAEANGSKALATWFPSEGQYWLAFSEYPPAALAISGDLPDGFVDASGTYQYTASGGVMPYTFAITAGSLPAGAAMSAGGLITYTYTTAGSSAWTVTVTDADGSVATLNDTATVDVLGPANVQTWYDDTTAATTAVPIPAGTAAGDLLVFMTVVASDLYPTLDGTTTMNAARGMGAVTRTNVRYRIADGSEGASLTLTKNGTIGRACGIVYRFKAGAFVGVPEALFDPTTDNGSVTSNPPALTPTWGAAKACWVGGYSGRTTTFISTWPYTGWRGQAGTANSGAIPPDGTTGYGTTVDREIAASATILTAASADPGAYVTGPSGGSVTTSRCAFTIAVRMPA